MDDRELDLRLTNIEKKITTVLGLLNELTEPVDTEELQKEEEHHAERSRKEKSIRVKQD